MSSKEIDVKHPLEKNLDNVDSNIHEMIHTIRGYQVIIDSDLALLYGVETKNLNKAVK